VSPSSPTRTRRPCAGLVCVCVCVCVCVFACVYGVSVCVCVCVYIHFVCVCVFVCVHHFRSACVHDRWNEVMKLRQREAEIF
jgi:hypothetical protein